MYRYNQQYYDPVQTQMEQRMNAARMYAPQISNYQSFVPALKGRIVTSIEEAKAAQIDLDGSTSFFPSPSENKIYVKSINLDGIPEFLTYALVMPEKSNKNSELDNIRARLEKLESLFDKEDLNEPVSINSNDSKRK